MKKGTKIWLWFALVLSVCTTILNATEGRVLSVIIAIVALAGLCLLLLKQKKMGFDIMCACNAVSFLVGAYGSIQGGAGVVLSIVMSLIGAAIIPGITFLFIRSQWKDLQ